MNQELEQDIPDFMLASIQQHQIEYKPEKPKQVLPDTNVNLEEIYFNSEKVDPMLNSISMKFKDEKKKDIIHYLSVTKKLEQNKLSNKIETRKPSFSTITEN